MSSTTPAEQVRGSLAARLTVWYSLFSFGLILAATAYLYWALAKNLDREDDGVLQDQIHILQVLLREHPEASDGIRQEVELESGARQHSRIYIRILDEAGKTIAETPGMAQKLPRELFPPSSEREAGSQLHQGKESFRLMCAPAPLGNRAGTRTLQVALDRREEDKLLSQFRRRLLPLLAISLAVCAVAGHQIARRGLRPIGRISEAAGRIRSTTLHERLPSDFPAELGGLARTFNDMLDRLQESFDRLSRFSADIAHELRTPLNTLRGEVEVALGKARSAEEYRDTLGSFLEEAGRLTRLIESLLFLARAEDPKMDIRRESLEMSGELRSLAEFYEAAAAEHLGGPEPVPASRREPDRQRAHAHPEGRPHPAPRRAGRRARPGRGLRHRPRHRAGASAPGLRPAVSGGPLPFRQHRRLGPRTGDRQEHRRAARRESRDLQRGREGDARVAPAARGDDGKVIFASPACKVAIVASDPCDARWRRPCCCSRAVPARTRGPWIPNAAKRNSVRAAWMIRSSSPGSRRRACADRRRGRWTP